MRSLKKLLAVLLTLTMVLSIMVVPAFAAESLEYEDEARVLYDLGLFKGTSATEYVPNLEARLERQEGVALVLRLFGLDTEAEKMSESEAKALLAEKFKDADEIGAWAVKYVAYAVKNGIVDGRPDGKFAPKEPLLGKEYSKMILAQLGQYDPNNFQTASADLAAISDLSASEAIRFNDKILIRDDLVGISYASLTAQYKDGGTVISKLAEANPALKEKAIELGFIAIAKVNTEIEPITIKVGESVNLPSKVEVEYADGSVADVDVSWNTSAVKADVAGEYKAVGTIVGYDGSIEVVITVTPDVLAVESVTTKNLKEVIVVYNQDVSENAEAAKKDNYKLSISKAIESVSVDGNTAVLKVQNEKNDIINQQEATLTISNKILEEEQKFEFTFFDSELPEVLGIEITGPKSIKVNFSEPIAEGGKITLKKGTSTLSVGTSFSGYKTSTINVPMYSTFADGDTYEITIRDFKDFAGYGNIVKTIEFVYEKDETPPVASVDTVKQEYVKVSFNKPVKGLTTGHFSHTFSAWTAFSLTETDTFTKYDEKDTEKAKNLVKKDESVSTVYVWFYNDGTDKEKERAIPEGETSFRVRTKDADGNEIKDEWGNKLEELNVTISVTADKTAPEIAEVSVVAEDEIKVKFSKNVSKFTTDHIEVLDANGEKIDGVKLTISGSGKEYNVKLGKKLAGKSILVNIKNVEDTTLSANKMEPYSTVIEITDKTAPVINKITYEDDNGKYTDGKVYLYVFYNENLDADSALKASNYFIHEVVSGSSVYTKLSGDTSFFSGEKIVKIKLTEAQYNKIKVPGKEIFVSGVKDIAGNEILPKLYKVNGEQSVMNKPAIAVDDDGVKQVKATAVDKIEVLFDQELASITSEAFTLSDTAYKIVGLDVTLDGGRTKAILTVEKVADDKIVYLPYDLGSITLNLVEEKVTNLFNVKNAADKNIVIIDKIAPEMDTIAAGDTDKTIEITFKETLSGNQTNFAHDLVITDADDKELLAGVDYTTTLSENKITVKIETKGYGKYTVKSVDTIKYIKDTKDNLAKKFDAKTVEIKEKTPPTVSKAITDQIEKGNGTATVEFSEAIDQTSKTAVENAIKGATANGDKLTFSWSEDKTLTVTNTDTDNDTDFGVGEVKVTIKDLAGNESEDVVIINIAAV
jgi:hypothetical protein